MTPPALFQPTRKLWCVLWDGKISMFKTEEYSRKYLLALSREQRGAWSQVGRRMMRDYAPDTQFDIQGWEARPEENNILVVSLYNTKDELQQVLEFESSSEALAWIDKVGVESQKQL